jgi:hypothetical protein
MRYRAGEAAARGAEDEKDKANTPQLFSSKFEVEK